jgi:hypothetical protein
MTAPPAPIDEFSGVFSAVQDGIGTVADAVNAIIDGINSVLHLLPPGYPVDGIRSGVEDLRRIVNEKIVELDGLLASGGDPDGLRAVGSAWANDIGGTTSRLAGYSTLNGVRSDDYWTGMAADAYRNTLIPQNVALTTIKTIGNEIDSTLNDLAAAITTFWVSVLAALGTLEVGLLAAAATAASVIGAPVGAGIGTAAFVAFGGAVVSALVAFNDIANDTANRSAELERRLSDDTAFTGGSWPRSTTPISGDGSITDGDDTDWHLR